MSELSPSAVQPPPASSDGGVRPRPVTAVCCVGWAVGAMQAVSSFSSDARAYALSVGLPSWVPSFLVACALLSAVSLFGMWRMRRWGVLGFILVTALLNGGMLGAHTWGAQFIVFPVVATLIGLGFLQRMK